MTQTLNTGINDSNPVQPPEGHDEKMAEKFDAGTTTASNERPPWLPEKFKSAEELAQAYASLEKKLGSGKVDEAAPQATEAPAEKAADEAAEQAAEAVEKAGLNIETLQSEYAEKGELSPESFKALEDAGIPRAIVEAFIAGQEARAAATEAALLGEVGGKEAFNEIAGWARGALSEAEVAAFNKSMESGDEAQMKLALAGLKARYEAANGRAPAQLRGTTSQAPGVAPFRSRAEVVTAMSDPRYGKDPAYRDEVARRLEISTAF